MLPNGDCSVCTRRQVFTGFYGVLFGPSDQLLVYFWRRGGFQRLGLDQYEKNELL